MPVTAEMPTTVETPEKKELPARNTFKTLKWPKNVFWKKTYDSAQSHIRYILFVSAHLWIMPIVLNLEIIRIEKNPGAIPTILLYKCLCLLLYPMTGKIALQYVTPLIRATALRIWNLYQSSSRYLLGYEVWRTKGRALCKCKIVLDGNEEQTVGSHIL